MYFHTRAPGNRVKTRNYQNNRAERKQARAENYLRQILTTRGNLFPQGKTRKYQNNRAERKQARENWTTRGNVFGKREISRTERKQAQN